MFKYNKKMEGSLKKITSTSCGFLEKIDLRWPEFVENNGFVLLKKDKDTNEELDVERILSLYHDRTGFEASYNELRIEDYFNWCVGKPIEGLALAFKLSEIWECKLKREFPSHNFFIIIGFDGTLTTIRFHKYRQEDGCWIAIENLDGYKEESIAVRFVE